jgi:hypothetical protein
MNNLKAIMKEKVLGDDAPNAKPGLLKKKRPFPANSTEVKPPSNLFKRLTGK